ncbi:hypothetical protein BH20ACI2_BH20ACI2_07400 [soil metagenome]
MDKGKIEMCYGKLVDAESEDHITGSHYILKKEMLRTAIPFHQSVKTGTLRAILSQCNLTIDKFIELL